MSRIRLFVARSAVPVVLLFSLASCGGPAKSLVSAGGILEMTNTSGEELEVFVNGNRVSLLAPDKTAQIDRLPAEEVVVLVTGTITGTRQSRTIDLKSAQTRWTVEADRGQKDALALIPTGLLKIENKTDEPIKPYIDGQAQPIVWPGADATYSKITLGSHALRGDGTKTTLRVDGIVDVKPSVIGVFTVIRPDASLELTNKTAFLLDVFVENHGRLRLSPGDSKVVRNIILKQVGVKTIDAMGRLVDESRVTVTPGQTTQHIVSTPAGCLSVISELESTILIYDGSRRLGEVSAGGGSEFAGLPIGLTELKALDPDHKTVADIRLDIKSDSKNLWIIEKNNLRHGRAEMGSIAVFNKTSETVRLFVDGHDRGQINAQGKRNIPDLIPGKHVVATLGLRSNQVVQGEVVIAENSRVEWFAEPMTTPLNLVNDREEAVRVSIDDEPIAVLAPSETREVLLAEGPHDVILIGVSSLRTTSHKIDLPAGSKTNLRLPPSSATIVFINHHGRDLEIGNENRSLGILPAGASVVIRDIDPGTHRLFAKAMDAPLSWNKLVSLSAGDTEEWVLEQ